MVGVVGVKVKPLPNSSAVLPLLTTVILPVAAMLFSPVRSLASLTVKPSVPATTPMLPLVKSLVFVLSPLMVKVSPSFLLTLSPVSPSKVSGDCARSYKSLTVAAEFGLSVLAVPKRVTKSGCPPLVAGLMADLTLLIS